MNFSFTNFARDYLTPLAVFIMALVMVVDRLEPGPAPTPLPAPAPAPSPSPAPNLTATGHSYGIKLASTYADAWELAADEVDQGKPIASVQADMQAAWKTARTASFADTVEPRLGAILPAGAEPDAATRPAVSKSYRDLAAGLRSIK